MPGWRRIASGFWGAIFYYLKRWETFFADPDNADAALDALERSAPSAVWAMPPKNRDILEIIAGIPLAAKYIINDD